MKYIQRVSEVEAMQFTRDKLDEIVEWTGGKLLDIQIPRCLNGVMTGSLRLGTLVQPMVYENDWIVKTEDGLLSVCRKDSFNDIYKPVE